MQKEALKLKGKVTIYNKTTGKIDLIKDNIIVNPGLYLLSDRLGANSVDPLSYLAIGDDNTTEAVTDSALYSEVYREAFTTISSPNQVFKAETTIDGSEAIFTWREMALFNASSSGVMFNRVTLNYTHVSGDSLNVIWEITFARG